MTRSRASADPAAAGGRTRAPAGVRRWRIRVAGVVQGVGFRPFVYRHAIAEGLAGWVRNDDAGVVLEVEGPEDRLAAFRSAVAIGPQLAAVDTVATTVVPIMGGTAFTIETSESRGGADVPVSVDVATCPACVAELFDPADRRYRYPFTNCTDCGPRYTILQGVPYDRPLTTMADFAMCGACQAEYDDPGNRRFHAEPNACRDCGPQLRWAAGEHPPTGTGDDALDAAVATLLAGGIVAVKGLGGYHLAVVATNEPAVAALRQRKARDDKPFAVMVDDIGAARDHAFVNTAAEAALTSSRRPVVLVPRRRPDGLAPGVAPGAPELGLLLPYTPLHHLLAAHVGAPLVMTSGNVTDEPIAHDDDDARGRLGPLVDGVLFHDRRIHIRCDDSVARTTPRGIQLLRRSRGFVPERLRLPVPAGEQLLAVGAELKNTVTVAREAWAVTSHHVGDLEHLATWGSFMQAIEHLTTLAGVEPERVVCDLHPEYLSTKWAHECGLPVAGVQHHHAHVASCLVDNGETGPVVGVAFDGTGYGTDGALWGGELLVADLAEFRRVGHLRPVTLPGGVAAIREPWRMAAAWLTAALGPDEATAIAVHLDDRAPAVVDLAASLRGPTTTSVGRLFDAVAALLGLRHTVTYEAQAAIALEAAARTARTTSPCPYEVPIEDDDDNIVLDAGPLVAAVAADAARARPVPQVAAGFHEAFGGATAAAAARVARQAGLDTVALTGGVFQNGLLTDIVGEHLRRRGLRVLLHGHVPPNDGGISIGQAAVAAAAVPAPGVRSSPLDSGRSMTYAGRHPTGRSTFT